MSPGTLEGLVQDILCGGSYFLEGVHRSSPSPADFVSAVVDWARAVRRRGLEEILAVVEPCVRQSVLMTLVPRKAIDPNYQGSIDRAIDEHLVALGLTIPRAQRSVLLKLCVSVRKYHGLTSVEARNKTMSLAQLRGMGLHYTRLLDRQGGRCIWCGVHFDDLSVKQTLEHFAPKHLGDDLPDASNWAIACTSCNRGKADSLAWAARAEAHDFLDRLAFQRCDEIGLAQRWTILMRERRCDSCGKGPRDVELWAYLRVPTGLSIPANCSACCLKCASSGAKLLINPTWDPNEAGRGRPDLTGTPEKS